MAQVRSKLLYHDQGLPIKLSRREINPTRGTRAAQPKERYMIYSKQQKGKLMCSLGHIIHTVRKVRYRAVRGGTSDSLRERVGAAKMAPWQKMASRRFEILRQSRLQKKLSEAFARWKVELPKMGSLGNLSNELDRTHTAH